MRTHRPGCQHSTCEDVGAECDATSTTDVASLVLFASDADRTTAFYRATGLALDCEDHGDGPVHFAVELGLPRRDESTRPRIGGAGGQVS